MAELDRYTREQAKIYADNAARLHGFKPDSPMWKHHFNQYLNFAKGTMSVGRNPRLKNPRDVNVWPEIFGSDGFSGKVSKNYKGHGHTGVPLDEVRDRIKSSVSNLVYMYLNGIYGLKTTTRGRKPGKISDSETSDLQLKAIGEELSAEEARAQNYDVLYNQLALTVIETACYEFLLPFFTMKREDVDAILDKIKFEGEVSAAEVAKARSETEVRIRAAIGDKLKSLSIRKLILGE